MKGHWWSCVLGLLCLHVKVVHNTETVSQTPSYITYVGVNSSVTITCSTSLSDALGLYLQRQFHGKKNIVYLSLSKGNVAKNTTSEEFKGRIQVIQEKSNKKGYGFTLQLSLLALDDTDLYYCQWSHFEPKRAIEESLSSNGTIIIVRDFGDQEECEDQVFDYMFIILCGTAFSVTLFIAIGVLILKYRTSKKCKYRPHRRVAPSLPNRPEPVHPPRQQRLQHQPYMTTSEHVLDYRSFL
ncbi:hypothetical protein Q5P01_023887 [Channa striata]|uniref:Immunoglobulin V-set domain-containing protein n=1 Tax=Channa striata TaxID=64152 RepID=A0AA88JAT3_CHASR|nr:hypothetical protein Q5P01_023887 [Channa striata]